MSPSVCLPWTLPLSTLAGSLRAEAEGTSTLTPGRPPRSASGTVPPTHLESGSGCTAVSASPLLASGLRAALRSLGAAGGEAQQGHRHPWCAGGRDPGGVAAAWGQVSAQWPRLE